MSRIDDIKVELDTDSLVRGYAGMTDQQASDDLNTVYRTRVKALLSGAQAFQVTDDTEFSTLSDAARSEWLSLCAISEVDPANGTPATGTATRLFGGGSATVVALNAFRTENVSRGVEIGVGNVVIGDVQNARAI
jgi:hypothetical protein